MSEIAFRPWVGSRYRAQAVRLLLVGESHYGEPDSNPAVGTTTVVEKWKRGEWNVRYLVAAARMLSGLQRWEYNRFDVLEEISFYNFVQVMMPWLDVRPTTDQFRVSSPAFLETLALLDPTHVLVTGKELWSYVPPGGSLEEVQLAGEPLQIRRYKTPTGEAKATAIPHLSRGFSPPRWHAPIAAFLSM